MSPDKRKRKRISLSTDAKETIVQESSDATVFENRYEIVREIGRGGMGIVYEAHDRELEMNVAVKVLPDELTSSKRAINDLKREAKLAMQLRHPNIAALYHFAHSGDTKFLVMELLEGQSLEDRLQEQEILELDEVIIIASQLAAALDYAHGEKVVHRDIKPDNIFLHIKGDDEQVRIMDFGIARQIKDSMTRLTKQDSSGTLLYMPPEQLQGKRTDGRADIYALGATLYECLAGTPPFFQGGIEYQIVNNDPQPIDELPEHVNAALLRALAKLPEERFATATEFAQALAGEEIDEEEAEETEEETDVYADLQPIPAAVQVELQGVNEDLDFTGDYDIIDMGHIEAGDLCDMLASLEVVKMREAGPNEDLCPPNIIFRTSDDVFETITVDNDVLHLFDDDTAELVPLTIDEALAIAAGLPSRSRPASVVEKIQGLKGGASAQPASLGELPAELTIELQGIAEEIEYTGEYECIELGHVDGSRLMEILQTMETMEVRDPGPNEDLCPAALFYRWGDGDDDWANVLASGGALSLCLQDGPVDYIEVSVEEAYEAAILLPRGEFPASIVERAGREATSSSAPAKSSSPVADSDADARREQILRSNASYLEVKGRTEKIKVWKGQGCLGVSCSFIPLGMFIAFIVATEGNSSEIPTGMGVGFLIACMGFSSWMFGKEECELGIDPPSDCLFVMRGRKRYAQKRLAEIAEAVVVPDHGEDGGFNVAVRLQGKERPWPIEGLRMGLQSEAQKVSELINRLLATR